MRLAKRIELIFGIATGVLEIITVGVLLVTDFSGNQVGAWIVSALLLWLAPGFLLAVGSYLHVLRERTIGFVMLLIGTLFLTVMMFVYALGGIFYLYGYWGFGFLLPSFTALVSGIASLFSIAKALESRIEHRQIPQ
jgi:hypothetical protein